MRVWCCLWPHGCSGRRRPRSPARLGGLTSFGAAPRSPPVPSGPSGALHTCGAGPLCVPVGGGPPARSPHTSLRLGVVDLEARPGPATAHRHRGQAPRFAARPCPPAPPAPSTPVGLGCCCVAWRVGSKPGQAQPPPTGAAAWPRSLGRPPHRRRLVADVWLGASARSPAGPRHRPRAPQPGSLDPQCGLACRAGILGRSAVCCYKRRQSEVFFVWISDPLLQTSSIRGLFR